MRRYFLAGLMLLPLLFCSCGPAKQPVTIERVIYDQGHGSAWGNQFYIELTKDRIILLQDIDPNDPTAALREAYDLPITSEQWDAVQNAVSSLTDTLTPQHSEGWLRRLFSGRRTDGGAYYQLSVITNDSKKEKIYSLSGDETLRSLLFEIAEQARTDTKE